jgi:hypothetical protein
MHLDYLTSLTEDNNAELYARSTPQPPVGEDEFPNTQPSLAADAEIREATPDSGLAISAQDFEDQLSVLLASATSEQMGTSNPFSDDLISQVANKLDAVGKKTWSERPRTYLVLRLVDHVRVMETFISEGFKDIDFPYTEATLPNCVNAAGARYESFISNVTS